MPSTMRAAVLTAPGIENLHVTDLPVPEPAAGQVRIKVMSFGLNRSEYHSVTGRAEGMSYPRVLGIEASGVVDLDPAGELAPGTQAATMMGGMGRSFDGGYAQYVVVPREQVITFSSPLEWDAIGSVPETLQTAYGALTTALDLRSGQSLLVRGGTSALGLAAAALAVDRGCRVLATSRPRAGPGGGGARRGGGGRARPPSPQRAGGPRPPLLLTVHCPGGRSARSVRRLQNSASAGRVLTAHDRARRMPPPPVEDKVFLIISLSRTRDRAGMRSETLVLLSCRMVSSAGVIRRPRRRRRPDTPPPRSSVAG